MRGPIPALMGRTAHMAMTLFLHCRGQPQQQGFNSDHHGAEEQQDAEAEQGQKSRLFRLLCG